MTVINSLNLVMEARSGLNSEMGGSGVELRSRMKRSLGCSMNLKPDLHWVLTAVMSLRVCVLGMVDDSSG